MIKGHTDIDIWNTGFFINADYFSDDFIIYNNTGKDLTRKTLAHPFFHNNSYKTTYTSFIPVSYTHLTLPTTSRV